MQVHEDHVVDIDGNVCTFEYFGTKEAAIDALNSLRNCRGLQNCQDCRDCQDCLDCQGLQNCQDCRDCQDCLDCQDCRGLQNCRYCLDCQDCRGLQNCRDCQNPSITGLSRSDGYTFYLTNIEGKTYIKAGCRTFSSFTEARKHWKETRGGTKLGIESLGILDILEAVSKLPE